MKKIAVLTVVSLLVMSLFALTFVTFVIADEEGNGDSTGSSVGGSSGGKSDGSKGSFESNKGSKKEDSGSKGGVDDSTDSKSSIDKKGDDSKAKDLEDKSEGVKKNDDSKESKMKAEGKPKGKDEGEKEEKMKTVVKENGVDEEVTAKTETEEINTFIDENGNKVIVTTKTEIDEGKSETVVETKTLRPDGTEIITKKETEIEGGKIETVFEKKITNPDGTEIKIKTKTEIKDGQEEVKNSIEAKGVVVTTKLSIKEETEGNQTTLKAKLSTGAEQSIIVLPDKALQTAFGELQATNSFVFELKEALEGDKRKAVFSATATKAGKLLGIFDTQVNLETLIDTVTGEIIETKRPWWAFLVVGANEATICHISSENKRGTLKVAIPAVKSHLGHGDTIGECAVVCGDGIISGPETCDDRNSLAGDGCDSFCQIEIIIPPPQNNATFP